MSRKKRLREVFLRKDEGNLKLTGSGRETLRKSEHFEEAGGEFGAGSGVFMFEEDIGFAPALRFEFLDPVAELRCRVIFAAEANVAPVGRLDQLRGPCFHHVRPGHAVEGVVHLDRGEMPVVKTPAFDRGGFSEGRRSLSIPCR